MLADIEAGKVGTVIVKDMSRLGRNYLQVGVYTEMLFPQKGVRFIAVNDNVDSANGGMDNDFTPAAKSVQRMAGERYEQENQGSKKVKRYERKACYQQAGLWLCDGRGREFHHRRGSRPGGTANRRLFYEKKLRLSLAVSPSKFTIHLFPKTAGHSIIKPAIK